MTDIVSIIRGEVAYLDIGTGTPPAFLRGDKDFQNLIADKVNMEHGAVFLTKPLSNSGQIEVSGARTKVWDLTILFAMQVRSPDMYNEDVQEVAINTASIMQAQFENRFNNLITTGIITGYNSLQINEIKNLFDKNISGVYFRFKLVVTSGDAICIVPGETTGNLITDFNGSFLSDM